MPVEESFKCECTKEFTGEFCEYKVVENSFFSMILTDKFNLTEFKQELFEEAPSTITTEEMENIKRVLTNSTHEEIMSYMVAQNSAEIVNELFTYGFWYVTDAFWSVRHLFLI